MSKVETNNVKITITEIGISRKDESIISLPVKETIISERPATNVATIMRIMSRVALCLKMPEYDFDNKKHKINTGNTIMRCNGFNKASILERSKFNLNRNAMYHEKNTIARSKKSTIHLGK
jgi:hypothetical protein